MVLVLNLERCAETSAFQRSGAAVFMILTSNGLTATDNASEETLHAMEAARRE